MTTDKTNTQPAPQYAQKARLLQEFSELLDYAATQIPEPDRIQVSITGAEHRSITFTLMTDADAFDPAAALRSLSEEGAWTMAPSADLHDLIERGLRARYHVLVYAGGDDPRDNPRRGIMFLAPLTTSDGEPAIGIRIRSNKTDAAAA